MSKALDNWLDIEFSVVPAHRRQHMRDIATDGWHAGAKHTLKFVAAQFSKLAETGTPGEDEARRLRTVAKQILRMKP